jgi:hypothetical protein
LVGGSIWTSRNWTLIARQVYHHNLSFPISHFHQSTATDTLSVRSVFPFLALLPTKTIFAYWVRLFLINLTERSEFIPFDWIM